MDKKKKSHFFSNLLKDNETNGKSQNKNLSFHYSAQLKKQGKESHDASKIGKKSKDTKAI